MKIYFDGCSWTMGHELENQEEERYSKLLCDQMGAEETNIAMGGGSNDRIVRNLLVENNIEDYDLAVIQMTFPVRTEYYNQKWIKVNPTNSPWSYEKEALRRFDEKFKHDLDFWKHWYMHVSSEEHFEKREEILYHTIRRSCKIPLILCTINRRTKLPFDLQLNDGTRNMRHRRGHPNKHLHRIFSDKILDIAKNL
jgi:hypothetical protein